MKRNLSKEEKEYQLKMIREFDMTRSSCANMKCITRKSYKELLIELNEDRAILKSMQDNYYDLKPTQIKSFFSHSKNSLVLAHTFIRTLYSQNVNKKTNRMFMKTARRFKDWYEENKMEKIA